MKTEYQIHGLYNGEWEEVHAEETKKEALARLKEYRENESGTAFKLHIHRVQVKKIKGAKTPLERHVQRWMNEHADVYDNGAEGVLNDLMKGGCSSGFVGHLIYYRDTIAFFKKYRKDISALLAEQISEFGSVEEMLKDWDKEDPLADGDSNRNLLAWYGFEEAALRLARNNDIEY